MNLDILLFFFGGGGGIGVNELVILYHFVFHKDIYTSCV